VRPVTLNLASRPVRNNTVVGSVLGIAGTALVLASVYNLYVFLSYGNSYAQLQREQAEDRVKIAELQVEEKRLVEEIRKRNFKRVFDQGRVAGELIIRGAFSWTELFNTLEGVVPPEVVMTAIRPNITAEGIVMRIEGVAKNHAALLAFETRLQQNPAFAKVYPSSERLLNPSMPDITFLLTCDYLPRRPKTPDQVADASTGSAPATQEPAAVQAGGTQAAAVPGKAAEPARKPSPASAGTIVGRDGLPRTVRAAAGPVVAPGAVYAPPRDTRPGAKPAARPAGSRKTGSAAAEPQAKPQASPKPAAVPPATPPPVPSTAPSATKRAPSGPRGYDPNVPHTMPPEKQAAIARQVKAEKKPTPAVRLDVPLVFTSRPVEEVYQRLSEAHGVRFDLDGSVERSAPVTINLRGRKLEDAILLIAGTARHKVRRVSEGVYKVSADAGGQAMGEKPIGEEPIHEDKP
jgi:Tfp pilus assembly protein PilN